MPDWISHIIFALILSEIFRIKKKSLVILGALLPDFIFKLTTLFPSAELYKLFLPTHSPIGSFLLALTIMPLFKYAHKKTLLFISIGWISHFLADSTTKFFISNDQMMLLFPFSWKSFGLKLIWAEQYYLFLTFSLLVYFIIILLKKFNKSY